MTTLSGASSGAKLTGEDRDVGTGVDTAWQSRLQMSQLRGCGGGSTWSSELIKRLNWASQGERREQHCAAEPEPPCRRSRDGAQLCTGVSVLPFSWFSATSWSRQGVTVRSSSGICGGSTSPSTASRGSSARRWPGCCPTTVSLWPRTTAMPRECCDCCGACFVPRASLLGPDHAPQCSLQSVPPWEHPLVPW